MGSILNNTMIYEKYYILKVAKIEIFSNQY